MHSCSQNCEYHGHCPFIQDPHNSNRYICLRCGTERQVSQFSSVGGFFDFLLLIAFAVLIASAFTSSGSQLEPVEELQPQPAQPGLIQGE